jgi:hypothetical protein
LCVIISEQGIIEKKQGFSPLSFFTFHCSLLIFLSPLFLHNFIARTVPSYPKLEIFQGKKSKNPESQIFLGLKTEHSKFYRGKTAKKFFL